MKKNKQNGFTLIELLIVVMIIGVLSGVVLAVLNTSGVQAKARDSQRISDLKKIQAALELYYADNRHYPTSTSWTRINGTTDVLSVSTGLRPNYISEVPTDPKPTVGFVGTTPCSNPNDHRYNYGTSTAGARYVLTAIMELPDSNNGHECNALPNYSGAYGLPTCTWPATVTEVCYGVQNP